MDRARADSESHDDRAGRQGMKVLRSRDLHHFTYLLVRCRCGKRFGQRADRRMVACLACGRLAELGKVWAPQVLVRTAPVAARRTHHGVVTSRRRVMRAATARRRRRTHK
jgi:hypothetical protein